MEKLQVDAKKLQLLNDRINQTIDAINQLRLTAQQAGIGIGHTAAPWQQIQQPQVYGAFSPYGGPQTPFGLGHSSFVDPTVAARQAELSYLAARGLLGAVPPGIGGGGLGHTSAGYRTPATEVIYGALDPMARQMEYARAVAENRAWEASQGIGHTSVPQGSWQYANPFMVGFSPLHGHFG